MGSGVSRLGEALMTLRVRGPPSVSLLDSTGGRTAALNLNSPSPKSDPQALEWDTGGIHKHVGACSPRNTSSGPTGGWTKVILLYLCYFSPVSGS